MSGRGPDSSIWRPFWTADALKVVGYAMADRMRTSLEGYSGVGVGVEG